MASTNKKPGTTKNTNRYFLGANLFFAIPLLIYIIAGALLLFFIRKGDFLLLVNSFSNLKLDAVFLAVTSIGLGGFVAVVGGLLLFYKIRWSVLVFINLALVGLFTFVFKKLLFFELPRPMHHFYYDDFTRFIHDAPLIYYSTFPSGHTMTIYGVCSLLAFLINRKATSFLLFVVALFVGLSRIYLLQHFFIDTYFGALLGVLITIITIGIDRKFAFAQNSFLNKGIAFHVRELF